MHIEQICFYLPGRILRLYDMTYYQTDSTRPTKFRHAVQKSLML